MTAAQKRKLAQHTIATTDELLAKWRGAIPVTVEVEAVTDALLDLRVVSAVLASKPSRQGATA